jgi:thiamine-phosphate pyrophosphorylase
MLPLPIPLNKPGKPLICYVTDTRALGEGGSVPPVKIAGNAPLNSPQNPVWKTLLNFVREAAAAGVDWIQLREKHLSARDLTALAREAVAIASATRGTARIIINDRLDIAVVAGAAGVHLGGESVPVDNVVMWRRAASQRSNETSGRAEAIATEFLIGKSCHSAEEIRQAEIAGADYVFFGPIFITPSKERYGPPQGLEKLAEACWSTPLPVLAIGGITAKNAGECLRAGASGIAAIRLFQQDPTGLRAVIQRLCPPQ